MKEKIRSAFENYQAEMFRDLAALVAINSENSLATALCPFGEGNQKVLELCLQQADALGFKTENVDYYAGVIEYGCGEEAIGVMAHLDIVPAGKGWESDPFCMTEKNGRLYGRGTSDNKGSVIAALYGMRILRDLGLPLTKKIQLIVGVNEEQGSGCMKYYATHRKPPQCGFTPDGAYPLIYGEKGNFWLRLNFPVQESPILEISGGIAFNSVPSEAVVRLDGAKTSTEELRAAIRDDDTLGYQADVSEMDGIITLSVKGRAAHGSTPHLGVNAIVSAAKILVNSIGEKADKLLCFVANDLGRETDGATLGIKFEDAESGSLTLNLGLITYNQEQRSLGIDIRYPVTGSIDKMKTLLEAMTERYDLTMDVVGCAEPHYVPKDHPLVQTLLEVYRDVSGEKDAQPFTIGGGTYARNLGQDFVAFGAEFPDSEPLYIHDVNEHVVIADFLRHCVICTLAMYELAK